MILYKNEYMYITFFIDNNMDSYIITPLAKDLEPWDIYKNEVIGINKDYNIVIGKDLVVLPFQPKSTSHYLQQVHTVPPIKMSFNDNSNVICVWMVTTETVEWCFIQDKKLVTQNVVQYKSSLHNATGLYNGMFGIYGKGVWEYDKCIQDSFNFYFDGITSDGKIVYHDDNNIYKGNEIYFQYPTPQQSSKPVSIFQAPLLSNDKKPFGNVLVNGETIAFVLNNTGDVYVGFKLLNENAKQIAYFSDDIIMLNKKMYNYKTEKYIDSYLVPDVEHIGLLPKDIFIYKNRCMYRSFGNVICKLEKNDRFITNSYI